MILLSQLNAIELKAAKALLQELIPRRQCEHQTGIMSKRITRLLIQTGFAFIVVCILEYVLKYGFSAVQLKNVMTILPGILRSFIILCAFFLLYIVIDNSRNRNP